MLLWMLQCMHIFKLMLLFFFNNIYPGVDHMVVLFLAFWETSVLFFVCLFVSLFVSFFLQWLHQFSFLSTVYEGSLYSTSSPTLIICVLFDDSHSGRCKVVFRKLFQFTSVTQSCPTLCNPMNCSTPGLPVHHQLLEFTQTHVHWVGDDIQPSYLLLSPSPPAPNPSQHQSLFQWVNSSHEVAKVLEFQL